MAKSMFARVITTVQVKQALECLSSVSEREITADLSKGYFEIKAPDGDVVFAGLEKEFGVWICRFHKEVFAE